MKAGRSGRSSFSSVDRLGHDARTPGQFRPPKTKSPGQILNSGCGAVKHGRVCP